VPQGWSVARVQFDQYFTSLKNLNPDIQNITKEKSDKALAKFLGNCLGLPSRKVLDAMQDGLRKRPGTASGEKWKDPRSLFGESERWWKERG